MLSKCSVTELYAHLQCFFIKMSYCETCKKPLSIPNGA